ncbi:hypothetical protein H0H93_005864 [Arthromyces matolae]|nr:hypothetical protein H0H93_005864 [Arthromyces matolae]
MQPMPLTIPDNWVDALDHVLSPFLETIRETGQSTPPELVRFAVALRTSRIAPGLEALRVLDPQTTTLTPSVPPLSTPSVPPLSTSVPPPSRLISTSTIDTSSPLSTTCSTPSFMSSSRPSPPSTFWTPSSTSTSTSSTTTSSISDAPMTLPSLPTSPSTSVMSCRSSAPLSTSLPTSLPTPTPSSTPSLLRFAKRALPTPSSSTTQPTTPPSATQPSTKLFTPARPHPTTHTLLPLPTPPLTQIAAGSETRSDASFGPWDPVDVQVAPPLFNSSPPPSSPPSDASFGPWDPVNVEVGDTPSEAMDTNPANNEPDELDTFFYSQVDDSREGHQKDNSTHSLRKRTRSERDPIASNKRRKVRKVRLTLGAGGGNGGGVNGGADPAHYWDPDCHRNGDRSLARTGEISMSRAAREAMDDILTRDPDAMDDDYRMEDQEDGQDGDYVEGGQAEGGEGGEEDACSKAAKSPKRKPRQRTLDKLAWKENGIPPPTTRRAQIALASLCTIWTSSNLAVLSSFLTQLSGHQHTTPPTILSSSTSVTSDSIFTLLETLMNHCDELTVDRALTDYKLMVAEFQLFSVVDT